MISTILIIDDDAEIRASLRRGLALEGYAVVTAEDGEDALRQARASWPDLVVLDLLLPGLPGLEVCRRLRAADPALPIVILSARDAVPDRVAGLEEGADDYLVKPFAFEELLARIRVRLRRRAAADQRELRFADLRLDTATREAWRGGRPIAFTPTEHELLRLFLQHPNQVLNRATIFERVWGYEFVGESKVIEVYVRYLREKLEASGEPRLIHTIRGAGYILRDLGDEASGVDPASVDALADGGPRRGPHRIRRRRLPARRPRVGAATRLHDAPSRQRGEEGARGGDRAA
jgi:DNA-binding response OmpR family regulator